MKRQDCEQLTLFPAGSPASRSPLPGSEEARRMTVTSGLKCSELCRSSGPLGSLVRTLLGSSAWRSTRCFLTWKASATPAGRLLFRLVPSTPRTEGTDAPLWPGTPNPQEFARMYPTPTRFDATCGDLEGKEYTGTRHAMKLIQAAKMWPTPIATDWKNRGCRDYRRNREHQLQTEVGGKLNPDWVEWLMGFPAGWTSLQSQESQPASRKE